MLRVIGDIELQRRHKKAVVQLKTSLEKQDNYKYDPFMQTTQQNGLMPSLFIC